MCACTRTGIYVMPQVQRICHVRQPRRFCLICLEFVSMSVHLPVFVTQKYSQDKVLSLLMAELPILSPCAESQQCRARNSECRLRCVCQFGYVYDELSGHCSGKAVAVFFLALTLYFLLKNITGPTPVLSWLTIN